jgi:hypothetical protein
MKRVNSTVLLGGVVVLLAACGKSPTAANAGERANYDGGFIVGSGNAVAPVSGPRYDDGGFMTGGGARIISAGTTTTTTANSTGTATTTTTPLKL